MGFLFASGHLVSQVDTLRRFQSDGCVSLSFPIKSVRLGHRLVRVLH